MPTTSAPEPRSLAVPLKALLARRVVDGGDTGWWRALIPALAVIAVLFAALALRSPSEAADPALDRAGVAQEVAASVDRLVLLSRAGLETRAAARRRSRPRGRGCWPSPAPTTWRSRPL